MNGDGGGGLHLRLRFLYGIKKNEVYLFLNRKIFTPVSNTNTNTNTTPIICTPNIPNTPNNCLSILPPFYPPHHIVNIIINTNNNIINIINSYLYNHLHNPHHPIPKHHHPFTSSKNKIKNFFKKVLDFLLIMMYNHLVRNVRQLFELLFRKEYQVSNKGQNISNKLSNKSYNK